MGDLDTGDIQFDITKSFEIDNKIELEKFTTHGDLAIIPRSLAIKIVYMKIWANLRLVMSNCTGDLFS